MQRVRRKVTINFTTSPVVVENMDKSVDERDYASRSEYISIAISEKLLKEELEAIDKYSDLFLLDLLSDSDSKYHLIELIPDDQNFKMAALKKKAKACIELKEFDEAIQCLQAIKTLKTELNNEPKNNSSNKMIIENGTIENENTKL